MADPAQAELDLYLNSKSDKQASHPEDENDSDSGSEPEEKLTTNSALQFSVNNDTDEEDLSSNMSTLTTSRSNYQIPTTISYANTGPKGVIADAQHFASAKKSTFRQTLANITNSLPKVAHSLKNKEKSGSRDSPNPSDDDLDSNDEEFMIQWRESRLKELQSQSQVQSQANAQRRTSPTRRTYGSVTQVDATGYLDAIEHSPPTTTVVVLLFDPTRQNQSSRLAERQFELLAYKYALIRFVKLDYHIAEMEYLDCPSVIAYRAGDVVGTTSLLTVDLGSLDGLEDDLKRLSILTVVS